ncbi:MAG: amino acid ABC transporter substrate-binding protein [Rhodocyclaceae bacterium]|nr:amino acid ABC transporter substrate-binding protein [Rhodocyclaceae bacterium]
MKQRKGWVLGALAAVFLAGAGEVVAGPVLDRIVREQTVRIGYRDTSMPFSYLVAQGDVPVGYSMDLCMKIVERIGALHKLPQVKVVHELVTSANRIDKVREGVVDLECGSTTSTAERRRLAEFTIPTFIAATRFLVRADSPYRSPFDLSGKRVVTTKGSTSEKLFRAFNEDRTLRATLVTARDHAESFSWVANAEAEAFVMDDVLLYSLAAQSGRQEAFRVLDERLTIEPLSIMLPQGDPEFKKLVDEELTRVILSREIHRIYRKWFESPIPPDNINLRLPMSFLLRDSFKLPSDWIPPN